MKFISKSLEKNRLGLTPKEQKRLFLIGFFGLVLILLLWSFRIKLESLFFSKIHKPELSTALILRYEELKPFRDWSIAEPKLKAQAAISVELGKDGSIKVLFAKNKTKRLAIASITKLISALVIMENYNLEGKVKVSSNAASKNGTNYFHEGEVFLVKDLLASSLIESSNRAIQTLADVIGEPLFVELMNKKAKSLGMKNTHFVNPTGLDPEDPTVVPNFSTVEDLVLLSKNLIKQGKILEMSRTKELDLYQSSGVFHHKAINTNELLGKMPDIVGGKTGTTILAGRCLLLILKNPKNNSFLVNVVLNSPDSFQDMQRLVNWVKTAYKW